MTKYDIEKESEEIELNEDSFFNIKDSEITIFCNKNVNNLVLRDVINSKININITGETKILFVTTNISTKNNVEVNCLEKNSFANIREIVLENKNYIYENRIYISHKDKKTKTNYKFFGFSTDKSKVKIESETYIASGMEFSNAAQNIKLISDRNGIVEGQPKLSIDEYNVKASHGNSIGQINEREIFFLKTKGISEIDAKWMILKGNISNILDSFEDKDNVIEIFKKQYLEAPNE